MNSDPPKVPRPTNILLLAAPAVCALIFIFSVGSDLALRLENTLPVGWASFAVEHAWVGLIVATYVFSLLWAIEAEQFEGTEREKLFKVAAVRALMITFIQGVIMAVLLFIVGAVFFMPTL